MFRSYVIAECQICTLPAISVLAAKCMRVSPPEHSASNRWPIAPHGLGTDGRWQPKSHRPLFFGEERRRGELVR